MASYRARPPTPERHGAGKRYDLDFEKTKDKVFLLPKEEDCIDDVVVGAPASYVDFANINMTSVDGSVWNGSADVESYYSGFWGGTIEFRLSSSPGGYPIGLDVPNIIQIQPEEATYTYASGAVLLSLEFLIRAFEIYREVSKPT